jgi:hypothetical protein
VIATGRRTSDSSDQRVSAVDSRAMAVVVNHLHLGQPLTDATAQAFRDFLTRVVDPGASVARILRAGDTHLILILDFASAEEADRIASGAGGPWMREHVIPLLARGPERSVGEVLGSATA